MRRWPIRIPWLWLVIGLFTGWMLFALLIAPALISAAYGGKLGFLATFLEGRSATPLERYLHKWSSLARSITFLLLTGVIVVGVVRRLLLHRVALPPTAAYRGLTFREFLLVVAGFGIATGLAEAYYVGAKLLLLHEMVPGFRAAGPNAMWMAPLSDFTVFLGAAVLLAPLRLAMGKLFGHALADRTALGVFSVLSLVTLLMLPGRVKLWAGAILAVGLTSLAIRSGIVASVARAWRVRTVLLLALTALALWSGVKAAEALRERIVLEGTTGKARVGAPNVLLLVLDTQRAQNMSLYGYSRPTTPRLNQLATESVVFDRAIASAPWTVPTHATMFTGRLNRELQTTWLTGLSQRFLTLAEFLRDQGYRTGGFVGNILSGNSYFGLAQGFSQYHDESESAGGILESGWLGRTIVARIRKAFGDHRDLSRKRAESVNREFLAWVNRDSDPRPFFAFLNYFDLHAPYEPTPMGPRWADSGSRYWMAGDSVEHYPVGVRADLRNRYDDGTAYADAQVGSLLDALRRRGVLDQTIVIVVGDHGEEFGEHGWMQHGKNLYLTSLWIPLLIRYPGRSPGGVRVATPVGLQDLPGTILDLAGFTGSPFPGKSLARYWMGGATTDADPVLSDHEEARSLVWGRYHLLRLPDGTFELFDIEGDSAETRNQASALNRIVNQLRAELERGTGH